MKIEDFVKEANKVANDSIKTKRIDSMLKTKKYISVAQKINLADSISSVALTKKNDNGDVYFHVNSVTKYMLYIMNLVNLYTELEVDFNNVLSEYDLLSENGLLEVIVAQIGEKEIAECQMFLDMAWNDRIQNEFSVQSYVSKQIERFGTLAGVAITPFLSNLTKAIEELDDEKVRQIADVIVNKSSN